MAKFTRLSDTHPLIDAAFRCLIVLSRDDDKYRGEVVVPPIIQRECLGNLWNLRWWDVVDDLTRFSKYKYQIKCEQWTLSIWCASDLGFDGPRIYANIPESRGYYNLAFLKKRLTGSVAAFERDMLAMKLSGIYEDTYRD